MACVRIGEFRIWELHPPDGFLFAGHVQDFDRPVSWDEYTEILGHLLWPVRKEE